MSIFSGISEVETSQGGVYFLPGVYKVRIERVLLKDGRLSRKFFIIDGKIVESSVADRPPGMRASQVIAMDKAPALRNIKEFMLAASGLEAAAVEEMTEQDWLDLCEGAVGEDQPFSGLELELTCRQIETKAGRDFTVHEWHG